MSGETPKYERYLTPEERIQLEHLGMLLRSCARERAKIMRRALARRKAEKAQPRRGAQSRAPA